MDRTINPVSRVGLPPLALLLILCGFLVAYQLLQGFGVGLFVLALFLTGGVLVTDPVLNAAAPATGREDTGRFQKEIANGFVCLLLFALVLLLFRVFATRFAGDLRASTLTDHYALFGFLVGAILPGLLAGGIQPGRRGGGLLITGILTLIAPGVIVLLWGTKCALALLAGLALGGVQAFANRDEETPGRSLLPALLAVAVALALSQWTAHLLPLAEMTRPEKIRFLAFVVGSLAALVLVTDVSRRPRTGRIETAPPPPAGEGVTP